MAPPQIPPAATPSTAGLPTAAPVIVTLQNHLARDLPSSRGAKMSPQQRKKHQEKLMRKLWQRDWYAGLRARARVEGAGDVDDFELWRMFHEEAVPRRPATTAAAASADRSSQTPFGDHPRSNVNVSSSSGSSSSGSSLPAKSSSNTSTLSAYLAKLEQQQAEKQRAVEQWVARKEGSGKVSPRSVVGEAASASEEWRRAQEIEDDFNDKKLFHLRDAEGNSPPESRLADLILQRAARA
mmetsp:Transcript_32672/g.80516  ORF Transcript_32672/g.80516 Transcript_32672/m.80516 type:complete len:239 (-) Transcript_32672:68-784(-)|eukprot:CAMPEP_0197578632 /NCGR_PEP_ID=MMETSP1326-20131121/2753_1 /TAXON_ID=1155430 /ORGANISM="Genus nov. species nov., Strain RCC2288" /LENGTH=238 /DNA_ID=CAMNT_0043141823 /DNA_START=97 /DNA_END=813 /DNA_ORIENTATION=-